MLRHIKIKEGDKNESNRVMSFRIDDQMLLEKCKPIGTKVGDL